MAVKTADSYVPTIGDAFTGPTLENPDAAKEYVLYIPMLAELHGAMTTFPFGKSTPPANESAPPAFIGPTFVKARVLGLKTPMLAESLGIITTLPVGPSTPPSKRCPPPAACTPTAMLEYL